VRVRGVGESTVCTTPAPRPVVSRRLWRSSIRCRIPWPCFQRTTNGIVIQLPTVPIGGAVSVTGALRLWHRHTDQQRTRFGQSVDRGCDGQHHDHLRRPVLRLELHLTPARTGSFFWMRPDGPADVSRSTLNFYCPATVQTLSATNRGANGTTSAVNFNVGNADSARLSLLGIQRGMRDPARAVSTGAGFFLRSNRLHGHRGSEHAGGQGPYFAY